MKFLNEYLKKVRESSIVNMFGAAPYLYMGKDRIEHEFKYKDIGNEEAFEEVLEMSNLAQSEMIRGVMNVLDHEGKEYDLNTINGYITYKWIGYCSINSAYSFCTMSNFSGGWGVIYAKEVGKKKNLLEKKTFF